MASFVIDKMFAILHTCKTARCVLLLAGLLAVFTLGVGIRSNTATRSLSALERRVLYW